MYHPISFPQKMPRAEKIAQLIRACERALNAEICIYDYSGRLKEYLPPSKTYHGNSFCRHINKSTECCGTFEHSHLFRKYVETNPDGFFKRCPANVLEYVVPIRGSEELLGAAMAGIFISPTELETQMPLLDSMARLRKDFRSESLYASLPSFTQDKNEDIRELMCAFARRLETLVIPNKPTTPAHKNRKWMIENLIGRRFARSISLSDLAKELGTSPSRARHIVKEIFGLSFRQLVKKYRIAQARQLLLFSNLPIPQIAENCGFADPSNFHKSFKQMIGTTPNQFRQHHRNV